MPALAIAAAMADLVPEVEPVLVGAERGIEAGLLPRRPYRYHLLPAHPIYRRQWWKNARWPLVLPSLYRGLRRIFADERPRLVLGTGGYASAPVAWWALRKGIPLAIQEQNAYPGLATRWCAPRARHVYLGLPEAEQHLGRGARTELFVTGNPIVPPTPEIRPQSRRRFGGGDDDFAVLVTGGSQGARAINEAVASWLEAGSTDVAVLWVTGRASYDRFRRYHAPPRVQVIDFLDPIADGYAAADAVIGRAGALTVAELCAWGLPSVLVPLPSAAARHQEKNADAMARAGAAWHLSQDRLDGAALGAAVERLRAEPETRRAMALAARERGKPDAVRAIVSHLLTLLEPVGVSQLTQPS